MNVRDEAGFTLIEIVVATFVMGILSVMGLSLLNGALSAKDQLEEVVERINEVELARAVMKSDFSQITERITRDEFGYPVVRAFYAGEDLDTALIASFVRGGNETPGLVSPSSSLQYVEYRFENDALIRRSRSRVDPTPDTPEYDRVLISDVKDVEALFFDGQTWLEIWDKPLNPSGLSSAPVSISFTLEATDLGEIEMLFLTPSGY